MALATLTGIELIDWPMRWVVLCTFIVSYVGITARRLRWLPGGRLSGLSYRTYLVSVAVPALAALLVTAALLHFFFRHELASERNDAEELRKQSSIDPFSRPAQSLWSEQRSPTSWALLWHFRPSFRRSPAISPCSDPWRTSSFSNAPKNEPNFSNTLASVFR